MKSLEVTIILKAKADGVASVFSRTFLFLLGIASGSFAARAALL